jgi:exosortase/archaeosortase family protein
MLAQLNTLPRWSVPLIRAMVAMAIGSLVFLLVADPVRQREAQLAAFFAHLLVGDAVSGTGGAAVLINPNSGPVFFGLVTRSCSATVSLLCMAAVSMVVPHRRSGRWRALACGLVVVAVANILRVTAVLVAGVQFGQSGVAPLHDIVGTPLSLFGAALGIVTWWKVLERNDESFGVAE